MSAFEHRCAEMRRRRRRPKRSFSDSAVGGVARRVLVPPGEWRFGPRMGLRCGHRTRFPRLLQGINSGRDEQITIFSLDRVLAFGSIPGPSASPNPS